MRDSDPRPMPPAVKAAYRNPIDLLGLLKSEAYSDSDRKLVRDVLLESLIQDLGNVHLPHGSKQTRTITQRVKALKDPVKGIGLILSVDDYGGKEKTLQYLAMAMESRWREWWDEMVFATKTTAVPFNVLHVVCGNVIGKRQYAWIAAQYARSVVGLVPERDIGLAIGAIEAGETWASDPSDANSEKASVAAARVTNAFRLYPSYGPSRVSALEASAYVCVVPGFGSDSYTAYKVANMAATSLINAESTGDEPNAVLWGIRERAYARLCELTKQLITPSLVDAR